MANQEDYEIDERAENDIETMLQLEQERKWRVISKFKAYISKEPEFSNIENLSGQQLLEIIETTKFCKNSGDYDRWHMVLLTELAEEIREEAFNLDYLKNLYNNIYNAIN